MWTIWIAAHRGMFFGLICLFVWGFATYWYARVDLRRYLRERRARTWSADMVTKTGKGGLSKSKH